MMVEKWDAPLDGMSHLHAVAEEREEVVGQPGFRPKVERLMQGMPSCELPMDINIIKETAVPFLPLEGFEEAVGQDRMHPN